MDQISQALDRLRAEMPLVCCQTNNVVTGFTANVLLAAGAAPAMVDDAEDAAAFAAVAGALLVNLGTLAQERTAAMRTAIGVATDAGTPWVLDPVAAGALPARTALAREFVAARPAVLRGNASEILGVAGETGSGRGVDSGDSSDSALGTALLLARTHGCVVAVSGEIDVITDGQQVIKVTGGHLLMTQVTGVGCALGALIAALLPVSASPLWAAAAGTSLLDAAGSLAAEGAPGPGTFAVRLLDELATLTPALVAGTVHVEVSDA